MKTYTFRIESAYCVETTVTLGNDEDVDDAFDEWMHVVENNDLYCHTIIDRQFYIHEPLTLTPVNVEELQDETEIP